MRNGKGILAAALYLAGFALALAAASPFVGWGSSAEAAVGIPGMARVSFFGSHLPLLAGGLLAQLLSAGTPEFAANVSVALLAGATLTLLGLSVVSLSRNTAAGLAAAAAVALFPGFIKSFTAVDAFPFTLFLAACLIFAVARFASSGDARAIYAAAFVTGLGAFHSGFLFVCGAAAVTLMVLERRNESWRGPAAVAAMAAVSGVGALAYNFLRPAVMVDFRSQLPPWLGRFEPLDNLVSRMTNTGSFSDMMLNFRAGAEFLSGAYVPFFLCWIVGGVFFGRRLGPRGRLAWLLPLPAVLFLFISTKEARGGYEILLAMFVCFTGACGAAALLESLAPGGRRVAAVAAALVLAIPPVAVNRGQVAELRPDHSKEYTVNLLLNMKRDAVFLVTPEPAALHGINYMRMNFGRRKDLAPVYPPLLLGRAYRQFVRLDIANPVLTPGEDEYRKLYNKIANLAPAGGAGSYSPAIQQRIFEGMSEIINEALILRNGHRRRLYYNRLDTLFNSRIYDFMFFMPDEYMFVLGVYEQEPFSYRRYEDLFIEMFNRPRDDDPMVREMTAVYFMNMGEHFYKREMYRSAVPLLEACAELDRDNTKCPFFLGSVYRQIGEYDLSIVNYKQALAALSKKRRNEPYNGEDYLMMAQIYDQLGMPDKAKAYENKVQPGGINTPPPGAIRPE